MPDAGWWTRQLRDRRSRRVVFLSHCLLNENTRYLGGACRQGAIQEVLRTCVDGGLGIIQMPCPEEHAWGGVLKRRLLRFFASQGDLVYRLRNFLLPAFLWYTRRVYRRIATQVAEQIADYQASGFTVVAIVGVDGSPSCGVCRRLDVRRGLQLVGQLPVTANAADMNAMVRDCQTDGSGALIELLRQAIVRRGLQVPFLAHDLIAELDGNAATFSTGPLWSHSPPG
jgi:uncharacterized protein YbbK (DUF523 family)